MLSIIRFFFGYVIFIASGAFPERFINLAARHGICLWDVKKDEKTFSAVCMASEYKALRKIAKKSFMKIRVQKKKGFPFILKKYKNRKGIFVGVFAFFIIIYLLSLHIWVIDVNGAKDVSESEILQTLTELGVRPGLESKKVNVSMVENSIMNKFNNISWISANIIGSRLNIELKEKISPPELVDTGTPCNITATQDAYVTRIEIYRGTSVIQVGDAVGKGQLLVNGIVEDDFGNCTFQHADAKIFANTKKIFHDEIPLQISGQVKSGKVIKNKKLKFLGLELPLSIWHKSKENYQKETKTQDLIIFGRTMPVSFYEEDWCEYKTENIKRTKEQVIAMAEENIKNFEKECENIKILNQDKEDKWVNGKYFVTITYNCEEDIAQKEPIITETEH